MPLFAPSAHELTEKQVLTFQPSTDITPDIFVKEIYRLCETLREYESYGRAMVVLDAQVDKSLIANTRLPVSGHEAFSDPWFGNTPIKKMDKMRQEARMASLLMRGLFGNFLNRHDSLEVLPYKHYHYFTIRLCDYTLLMQIPIRTTSFETLSQEFFALHEKIKILSPECLIGKVDKDSKDWFYHEIFDMCFRLERSIPGSIWLKT